MAEFIREYQLEGLVDAQLPSKFETINSHSSGVIPEKWVHTI